MLKETHTTLDETLICKHLRHVTEKDAAWILLQEPGFIGFGIVTQKKIYCPPRVQPDWTRISDLRLFGEKGEWHLWRDWDGNWKSRLLELKNINDALTEYHFLWGTQKEESEHPDWIKLVEKRGTEIWMPLDNLKDSDLPLRLKLKQIVCYDPGTHLVGVTDAALVGLTLKSKAVICPPASLND